MTKHTPEPWHVGEGNGEGSIFSEDGRMRMETSGTNLYPIASVIDFDGEREANSQRIVDCVNGCRGLNPLLIHNLINICRAVLVGPGKSQDSKSMHCVEMLRLRSLIDEITTSVKDA